MLSSLSETLIDPNYWLQSTYTAILRFWNNSRYLLRLAAMAVPEELVSRPNIHLGTRIRMASPPELCCAADAVESMPNCAEFDDSNFNLARS